MSGETAAPSSSGAAETVLVLEPIGGMAGDMCLAALLHLGRSLGRGPELRAALDQGLARLAEAAGPAALDLARVEVRESEVEVSGIRSLHVQVIVPPEVAAPEPHHRPFRAIRDLLSGARIPEGARARALSAFRALAVAEGRVHGVPADEVEFHEVGGVDSLVDVTGVALLLEALGAGRVLSLPPPAGGGIGRSAHGQIPYPAPATVEVLRGRALRPSGPGERTTPTGAALIAALTEHTDALPELALLGVGYGAGTRRWDDAPNLLRAVLGRPVRGSAVAHGGEGAFLLEANLDDLSPQLCAAALEALLAAGALDAWVAPVTMKKGRPGHLLAALCSEATRAAVEEAFFRESSTLGLRISRVERSVLERELVEVETAYGPVRVKLGRRAGRLFNAAPEYEDCALAARAHGVPVKEVIAAASAAFRAWK